ncbi:MAG TPA: urease accessory protein UreD [Stellaceae bacterium]|nr:urease accessory protein UreD [Stellaceae bacterium]
MSAATSRYEAPAALAAPAPPPALERGDGAAEIVFTRAGLARLYQRTPCRVLFPRPEPGDLPLAALLTTSGGLAGGDRLRLSVALEEGARAVVATAAAEKVYRSLGPDAAVTISLAAEEGAWLEWLPQETILFDGARLVRRIAAALAPGARLIAAETLVFGRAARGERFARGLLSESWRVRCGGRLVWADALRLDGDIGRRLAAPAGFGGAGALATVLYVGTDAASHLAAARALAAAGGGAASLVNGLLLARFLAPRAEVVRDALARYVAGLRAVAAGLPATLPRLWHA